ncbi:MAG: DNA primase, partial [Pseudomonadota bacterium]
MAGHIPEEIIEEIQSRCDIVEVIGGYIPLKRAGTNYKALCPFHNEKTPSFTVSQAKQICHCFGCSAGGNVINFVMKYEHLDFVDAVKLLADKAGIEIPEKHFGNEGVVSKGLWDVNKSAAELFSKWLYSLEKGREAFSYLKNRGITEETIKKFSLGYAPGTNELVKELTKKGFSSDLLLKAGVAVKTDRGVMDMFRNRLMFPVFNPAGKVVGFSGRVLDNGLPKYLNTPETSIFHKGKILYGLHASKGDILKDDRVVICEGYFDFLRTYQEGLRAVVASQGTAFTIDHVHLLRRYASGIVICFDGDAAGNKASIGGINMFLEQGAQVRVMELPAGYDPDTFINDKGISEFKNLADTAKDILDIKLNRLCSENSMASTEGKLKVIAGILPDILNVKNEIHKRQFVKKVADKLFLPEESIWLEIRRVRKPYAEKKQQGVKAAFTTENVITRLLESPAEKHLVQMSMDDEPLSSDISDTGIINQMRHPVYKIILESIMNLKKNGRWKGTNSLMTGINDEGILKAITQLAAEEMPQGLDKRKNISDCIYAIKKKNKEERVRGIIAQIKDGEK